MKCKERDEWGRYALVLNLDFRNDIDYFCFQTFRLTCCSKKINQNYCLLSEAQEAQTELCTTTVWHVKGFTFTAVSHSSVAGGVLALNCHAVFMFNVSPSSGGSLETDFIESRPVCQEMDCISIINCWAAALRRAMFSCWWFRPDSSEITRKPF